MKPFISCGFFHRLFIFFRLFLARAPSGHNVRMKHIQRYDGTISGSARLRLHTRCKDLVAGHFIVMNFLPTRRRWKQSAQTYQMSLASARSALETGTVAITLRLGATGAVLWCQVQLQTVEKVLVRLFFFPLVLTA